MWISNPGSSSGESMSDDIAIRCSAEADLNAVVYNGDSRDVESGLLQKQLGERCTVAVACAHTLLMS